MHVFVTVTDSRHSAPAQNLAIHNAGGIVKVSIVPYAEMMFVQVLQWDLDGAGRVWGWNDGWKGLDAWVGLGMTVGRVWV